MSAVEVGGGGDASDWNGDHGVSVGALYFSLDNYVIPEVTQEHASDGWTPEQIREEAINRISKRSAESMKYYLGEIGDDHTSETTKQWDITETSPGVLEMTTMWADKRVSLRQLWQGTKDFAQKEGKLDAYDPAEEKAQMAMQDAFIAGKIQSYAAPLWHPDGNVQLIQVFEKNANGSLTARQIDVGIATGRNLTPAEAKTLIGDIAQLHNKEKFQAETNYPHVMTAQKSIRSEEVTTLVRSQVLFTQPAPEKSISHQVVHQTAETVQHVAHNVLTDTRQTIGSLYTHLRERHHDSAVRRSPSAPEDSERQDMKVPEKQMQKQKRESPAMAPLQPSERLTLTKQRERPLSLRETLQERHRGIKLAVQAIAIVSETKIAMGAVPLLIASLAGELPKSVQTLEKSIARHLKKETKRRIRIEKQQKKEVKKIKRETKESDRRTVLKFSGLPVIQKEKRRRRQKRKERTFLVSRKKEYITRPTTLKEVKQRKHPELALTKKREKKLVSLAKRLAQRFELVSRPISFTERIIANPSENKKSLIRPEKTKQQIEKTAIAGVSLAWTLWLLLSLPKRPTAIIKRPTRLSISTHRKMHEQTPQDVREQPEGGKASEQEASPWLLLAIIWYLSMVREAGISSAHSFQLLAGCQKTRKQKKKAVAKRSGYVLPILPQGVIFAFAS